MHYDRISTGTSYSDAVYEHTSSGTAFYKSRIAWNGDGWNRDLKDGSRITFREGFARDMWARNEVRKRREQLVDLILRWCAA